MYSEWNIFINQILLMEATGNIETRETEEVFQEQLDWIEEKKAKLRANMTNDPDTTDQLEEVRKTGVIENGINTLKGIFWFKEKIEEEKYPTLQVESARQFTVGQQLTRFLQIDDIKEEWGKAKEDWNKVKDFFNIGKEEKK